MSNAATLSSKEKPAPLRDFSDAGPDCCMFSGAFLGRLILAPPSSHRSLRICNNFEVFTPCDFIAAITQHIPDKSFQLVRYYGWYSNKMRGQRDKRAAEETQTAGQAVQIIDVSEHKPRRIPSAKWRDLIKKVWEADPLLCPKCQKEMRIVSLIDDRDVIERILRLWEQGVRVSPARAPPEIADRVIEPCYDDPFPDYDTEPVMMYANG